ncbi:MAG: tetratricopeptide repeat protein [Planctomycetes bacterium]|nr:tetratricopeptide repeat protein [Planctomycetota bacterium]
MRRPWSKTAPYPPSSEAEQLFAGGLAIVHRVWGEENERSPTFLQGLAFAYQMQGRYEEAERLFNRRLDISRRLRGDRTLRSLGQAGPNQSQTACTRLEYWLFSFVSNSLISQAVPNREFRWGLI